MTEALELTVKKLIKAPAERVFMAWLNPEMLAAFIRPAPEMRAPEVTTEAKEGGKFKIVMHVGDTDMAHTGEYREISPNKRLVFTWNSAFSSPDSLVTLTFKEISAEETEVTLYHQNFPNEESRGNHEGGWKRILETLATSL